MLLSEKPETVVTKKNIEFSDKKIPPFQSRKGGVSCLDDQKIYCFKPFKGIIPQYFDMR